MEEFYNQIRKWDASREGGEDVKLGRSPGWNPVRAECSKYCIYAYVNKKSADRGREESDLRGNTCDLHTYTAKIASLPKIDEFRRSDAEVALDLKNGESRGYWKYHAPGKWLRQAKITGKINHEKAILLLDTGPEVSILDTTFARKVECHFDTSQRQECVGIGDNVYTTEGRTRIKITLAGYLVYLFDIWIGDLSGQDAILGMDFMIPAGVRMDLAKGSMCLPDEVGIPLNGRKRLYGDKVRSITLEEDLQIPVGESEEVASRVKLGATEKLWVTRGERWVPTVVDGPGRTRYLVISNLGEKILRLDHRLNVGMVLDREKVPRSPGFVSVGSRRYMEWQNLALESTVEARSEPPEIPEEPGGPLVERPTYAIPRSILRRGEIAKIDREPSSLSSLEARSTIVGDRVTEIDSESFLTSSLEARSQVRSTGTGKIRVAFLNSDGGDTSKKQFGVNPRGTFSGDAGGGGIRESMPDQAPDRTCEEKIEAKTSDPGSQT